MIRLGCTAQRFDQGYLSPVDIFQLLEEDQPILRFAREITHTHHEKYNGSGYPRGLKGDAIPIEGRIAAATGDALLDLVDPEHARRHHVGGFQRFPELALGFAVILVVHRAEVQSQQGHAEDARRRLGGQTLAAALNADEQDAFGYVEVSGDRIATEDVPALFQPPLQVPEAAHFAEVEVDTRTGAYEERLSKK